MLFFCDVYLINMHRINIFGGEKAVVECVDRSWSVVIPPKFSDQLSWKWRQQTSKSAMFLASLACLKNDRSTSSSYFTAQCSGPVGDLYLLYLWQKPLAFISKHCFNTKYSTYQHWTQAHIACVTVTMATRSTFFIFWTKSHKIVEILALLTTKLSSSKIYKVGMLFCIL